jgi:hypothetical protein
MDKLIVRGARQHNLKNITVEIPRDKLVVFTGLIGLLIFAVQQRLRDRDGQMGDEGAGSST